MPIQVEPVDVAEIFPLRDLYRQELNCQIIHDSLDRRGFNDAYLIRVEGQIAGYRTHTSGQDEHKVFPRGIVNEFYLLPDYKTFAVPAFRHSSSPARGIRLWRRPMMC